MNALIRAKIDSVHYRAGIFETVLKHFGKTVDSRTAEKIAAVVDFAYTNDLLFEEFELWMENKNDKVFLYQVDHFLENKDKKSLPSEKRDLTGKSNEIQAIKEQADRDFAKSFATKLQALALERGLKTNQELGEFLGGMTAEQARVLLEGRHKPQRKTLLRIAAAFETKITDLITIESLSD